MEVEEHGLASDGEVRGRHLGAVHQAHCEFGGAQVHLIADTNRRLQRVHLDGLNGHHRIGRGRGFAILGSRHRTAAELDGNRVDLRQCDYDGTVSAVHVEQDQPVSEGDPLV